MSFTNIQSIWKHTQLHTQHTHPVQLSIRHAHICFLRGSNDPSILVYSATAPNMLLKKIIYFLNSIKGAFIFGQNKNVETRVRA